MTNRLLTLAVIGAVGAGSAATVAAAHQGGHANVRGARAQIATVSSYADKVLTLKTTDGTTVAGKVTGRTHIQCLPIASGTTPTPTPIASPEPTPTGTTPPSPSFRRGDDNGENEGGRPGRREHWNGDDENDDSDVCDTSLLTSGEGVIAASTALTSTGQKFTSIVLVSQTASSGDDTDS